MAKRPILHRRADVDSDDDRDRSLISRTLTKARFGGVDLPAAFVGMLAAVSMVLILGGIVGAIAGTQLDYQSALTNVEEATVGAVAVSLLILIVSFFVGGWAAGRMARFDGVANGILVGVLAIIVGIVLAAITAAIGTEYDLVPNVNLNQFATDETLTAAGALGALLALLAILAASALGGQYGERYNEAVDSRLTSFSGLGRRRRAAAGVSRADDDLVDPRADDSMFVEEPRRPLDRDDL